MELGIFLPISNNGWIVSKSSPQYKPTFELNKRVTQLAESLGFDFVFSMARWKGYGGETEHWDHNLESIGLMCGLAPVTERVKLFATVHPTTINPAVAAKMIATLDDISDGRAGFNIATGWDRDELARFGAWPVDDYAAVRYDYAEEWLQIAKELWETGRCTFKGKYFEMDDAISLPKPKRQIPIFNAGMSPRGLAFSARYADTSFVMAVEPERVRKFADMLTEHAPEGSRIKLAAVCTIVPAPTDEEAHARVADYKGNADLGAVTEFIRRTTGASATADQAAENTKQQAFFLPSLVGSPESIAEQMRVFSESGVDVFLLTFPDFVEDLEFFGQEILGLLTEARV